MTRGRRSTSEIPFDPVSGGHLPNTDEHEERTMPLFMDVHTMDGQVGIGDVAA